MSTREMTASPALPALGTGLIALCLALVSCVPWTVRRIEDEEQGKAAGQRPLNPAAYVDSIWSAKLIPEILHSAVDARTLLQAISVGLDDAGRKYGRREGGGAYHFMAKGEGRALSVDTSSRNGLLFLDLAPYDQRPDLSIQIGPVLRGSSLRDAPGIARFTDFVNQLQFADVGNELNRRVLETVLGRINPGSLQGQLVTFAGTFSLEQAGQPPIRDIVPVSLVVEARR
jgi:predicted lipoprotein